MAPLLLLLPVQCHLEGFAISSNFSEGSVPLMVGRVHVASAALQPVPCSAHADAPLSATGRGPGGVCWRAGGAVAGAARAGGA